MMSEKSSVNKVINKDDNEVEWIKFPFKIADVDAATNAKLLKDFSGERTGFVQVGPKKWFLQSSYKENAEIYYNFQARPDDVWIVTFPRSGTTWTQELVWLLANNLNYEIALQIPLDDRFPFLEYNSIFHPDVKNELLKENIWSKERCSTIEKVIGPVWESLTQTTERRFIKTHLPFQLLPPNLLETGCKVIYVARNPKDVAVSYYHLNRSFRNLGYLRDFSTYWDYFKRGLQLWAPYWLHVQEGWERRNESNLHFMFYEDMNKDLRKCITNISTFLGVKYSNKQYEVLEEHLKIENFRKNKSVNADLLKDLGIIKSDQEGFIRKGKSGGWKDYFVEELNCDADEWIENNLKETDMKFPQL